MENYTPQQQRALKKARRATLTATIFQMLIIYTFFTISSYASTFLTPSTFPPLSYWGWAIPTSIVAGTAWWYVVKRRDKTIQKLQDELANNAE